MLIQQNLITNVNDLGIITPYNAQADLISKIINEYEINNVECGTVHRFQGNQRDVIIFDLVDSYGLPYVSQFLYDFKLINVAVTCRKWAPVIFCCRVVHKLPLHLCRVLFVVERIVR